VTRTPRPVPVLRVPVLLALLLAGLLLLPGCVSIPTSGPVEKVQGPQPTCEGCVDVAVAPPLPGATPLEIVRGFLRANANYQPGYTVAKQYLSTGAAEKWSPESGGATIYSGQPEAEGDKVTLKGDVVGALDEDRTFTVRHDDLTLPFQLVQVAGEWRIANPYPALFIDDYSFTSRYAGYSLYFLGDAGALVPSTIYLPQRRNPASIASSLVAALLAGPAKRLADAVTTAAPAGTTLSADSVTITDGTAQVALNGPLQQLDDTQRGELAAQLVWTLKQLSSIQKVLLVADGSPIKVPQSEVGGLAVPVSTVSDLLDPVPTLSAGEPLAVVRDGRVGRVDPQTTTVDPASENGGLGGDGHPVDSLALSPSGTAAAVTDRRTVLRSAPAVGVESSVLLDGVSHLLRPQVSRLDEVWAVGRRAGRQRMWVATSGRAVEVRTGDLPTGEVRAFRISPDGARMALLVTDRSGIRLGTALIRRPEGAAARLTTWQQLDLRGALTTADGVPADPITDILDVAWADPTTLLALTRRRAGDPASVTRVSDDASSVESDSPRDGFDPVELGVLLRTGTAVVRTRDDRVFRDDGQSWSPVVDDVSALASPG